MAVGEGRFVLYSRIEPPLTAGQYLLAARQELTATDDAGALGPEDLPVADLATHLTVRSPRFSLPPDQVLSTFPPARSEGNYGTRLPQVVIRRRTLPWEREVHPGAPRRIPWLALVLVAEGEAQLVLNQPVADCVTPGVVLPGRADTELGNCLHIRKSMVDRIFPTQADVPLLAHAREVDLADTELMMGDDDGFLAVIVSNRLPLPGRDPTGAPNPIQYLACLVNLEGQFARLPERAPPPDPHTRFAAKLAIGDIHPTGGPVTVEGVLVDREAAATSAKGGPARASAPASTPVGGQPALAGPAGTGVYAEMARDFSGGVASGYIAAKDLIMVDPTLVFPVLLHWSFTSYGNDTFRSLMEGLSSGLLGTVPAVTGPSGRPPLEVTETGHIGLIHRTRRGDQVRSWYRGPLVAHPMVESPAQRLPLAHAADQVRIVVPDGREDISLAAGFEIGRLLALARPSMVAALMRWRQTRYHAGRRQVVWTELAPFLDELLGTEGYRIDARLGVRLGRGLVESAVARLEEFLGAPRPPVTPGRPLVLDGTAAQILSRGFGLDAAVLRGDLADVLARLRGAEVAHPAEPGASLPEELVSAALSVTLADTVAQLHADAMAMPAAGLEPGDFGWGDGEPP